MSNSFAVIGEFQTIYFITLNKLSPGTLFIVLSKIFFLLIIIKCFFILLIIKISQ